MARSRHRLQNHMRGGGVPRKRIAWLSAGIAVTAAAAVAIAVLPGTPPPDPARHAARAPEPATGQEVLLAAAAGAAQADDGSGAYWHVTIEEPGDTYQYWTALCRPIPRR